MDILITLANKAAKTIFTFCAQKYTIMEIKTPKDIIIFADLNGKTAPPLC